MKTEPKRKRHEASTVIVLGAHTVFDGRPRSVGPPSALPWPEGRLGGPVEAVGALPITEERQSKPATPPWGIPGRGLPDANEAHCRQGDRPHHSGDSCYPVTERHGGRPASQPWAKAPAGKPPPASRRRPGRAVASHERKPEVAEKTAGAGLPMGRQLPPAADMSQLAPWSATGQVQTSWSKTNLFQYLMG